MRHHRVKIDGTWINSFYRKICVSCIHKHTGHYKVMISTFKSRFTVPTSLVGPTFINQHVIKAVADTKEQLIPVIAGYYILIHFIIGVLRFFILIDCIESKRIIPFLTDRLHLIKTPSYQLTSQRIIYRLIIPRLRRTSTSMQILWLHLNRHLFIEAVNF